MSTPSIKRRLARARVRASNILEKLGYEVEPSGGTFCLYAIHNGSIRFIRVVVDEVIGLDLGVVKRFNGRLNNSSKEIWCKKKNKPHFEILKVYEFLG